MRLLDRLYWHWLQFEKFQLAIDAYCARLSENWERLQQVRLDQADVDRREATLLLNMR